MRILTRYVLREVTAHALIGVAIFTFVLFTRDLGHILVLVVRASGPLPSVLEVLPYPLPTSVLVGILIGLSVVGADSESAAMSSSEIGVGNFLRILAIFVLGA